MTERPKILIDCDPGHDDAAAILYAARHLELVAITTVFGNQDVAQTTRNALRICTLAGLEIPVAQGASRPWVEPPRPIPETHGRTGIDGALLPESRRAIDSRSAVELMLEMSRLYPQQLVIAALGPLTNVATALRADPELSTRLRAITLMGGSTTVGNVTPVAEFNIFADPEAAHAVFNAGVPLYMCGLNITRQVGVGPAHIEQLASGESEVGRSFAGLFSFYRERLSEVYGLATASLHDPCALMPLIDETLVTFRPMHVDVELSPGLTRGMTVCDARYVGDDGRGVRGGGNIRDSAPANVKVGIAVDAERAVASVLGTLQTYA